MVHRLRNTIFAQMQSNIPFSPPRIDEQTVEAVADALRSGWITTGPRTKRFELELAAYCQAERVICLYSWTNAAELVLRWFGVGPGDEVIVPAYTYAASANIILHVGATPVLADCAPDSFHVEADEIKRLLTPRTKVVIPVDIGGWPCDVEAITEVLHTAPFQPNGSLQTALGRPLLLLDAAHSFGALHNGKPVGSHADVTGFSFHAVKNLTTAEGGALAINTNHFHASDDAYRWFNTMSLHGQSKDALAKSQVGGWRYDIAEPGYKCNMTDIQAAIGLVELGRYAATLSRRKAICERYTAFFEAYDWALPPQLQDDNHISSFHLYMLRINGATETQRDAIMEGVANAGVSVNVHFQPLPLLTAYRNRGFTPEQVPQAMAMYANEISLPVYFDLTDEQVDRVCEAIATSVTATLG